MRLRPFTHIPPAMTFAENGGTGEGRAENTTATGFNVDQFTFMFRGIVPNRNFATLFAANHEVLNGTNSPLWIHVDVGNGGISLRYYRSGNRGQWNWPNIVYGSEYVLMAQYDRVLTTNIPRFWLRRVGVDKRLREVTREDIQNPTGTANSPAAGYTVSDNEFGLGASGAPARVAFVQFWDRFLGEREAEDSYREPFKNQNGLILGLDGRGIDHSPRKQHATIAGAGAGTTYGFSPFELDEWDLEPRSVAKASGSGGISSSGISTGAGVPIASTGKVSSVSAGLSGGGSCVATCSKVTAIQGQASGGGAPAPQAPKLLSLAGLATSGGHSAPVAPKLASTTAEANGGGQATSQTAKRSTVQSEAAGGGSPSATTTQIQEGGATALTTGGGTCSSSASKALPVGAAAHSGGSPTGQAAKVAVASAHTAGGGSPSATTSAEVAGGALARCTAGGTTLAFCLKVALAQAFSTGAGHLQGSGVKTTPSAPWATGGGAPMSVGTNGEILAEVLELDSVFAVSMELGGDFTATLEVEGAFDE